MRIFLTGATGFIGSHFLRTALAAGHEVVALRRSGSIPRISLVSQPLWIEGSLEADWSSDLRSCDVLVHFAAQGVSPQETDWNRAIDANVRQSAMLVDSAINAGIPKIIACGSCMEYGNVGERYLEIPPDAPLEPIGPYATSKAAFSLTLAAMARTNNSELHLIRPFHLYGEGQHESNLWPSLKRAALEGMDFPMTLGEQIRDFMSVETAASEFLNRVEEPCSPSRSLRIENIGSGKPVSLIEFARQAWVGWQAPGNLLPGTIPYRENEIMRFVPLVGRRNTPANQQS